MLTHLSAIGYNLPQPLGILLRKVFYHEQEPLPAGRSRPPRLLLPPPFATVAGLGLAGGCLTPAPRPTRGPAADSTKSPRIPRFPPRSTLRHSTSFVDNGPKADDEAIAASTWATAVRAMSLRSVAPDSHALPSSTRKTVRPAGFDAGIAQLLSNPFWARTGRDHPGDLGDTRESVPQNGQVDAVFATYTITDERRSSYPFAGPYYYTRRLSWCTLADNDDIKSVDTWRKSALSSPAPTAPAILRSSPPRPASRSSRPTREGPSGTPAGPR